MATKPTPLPIPATSQEKVLKYWQTALDMAGTSFNIRERLLERDRAYYREEDQTTEHQRAKLANIGGDASRVQNMTVPVVMPQVESALAYLSDTFLTGYPIFGVVAPPEFADALGAMSTLIGENSIRAGWPAELMKIMRDGLKYDLGIAEVVWEKKHTFNITTPELKDTTRGSVDPSYWEGNTINWRSPYNVILDTRVAPDRNHLEGEFAGYVEIISRIETKKRMADLDPLVTMNFKAAWESATPGNSPTNGVNGAYYTPYINPNALLPTADRREFSWTNWAGIDQGQGKEGIKYRDSYEWGVIYARVIPDELGINVTDAKKIQIWKFTIINRQVVIAAERMTNAHNYLPLIVCKPSNDGMGYQSKSFAENATPIQQLASSLTNSALASQRRKVYDRMLYDPTKVRKQDIENTSPVARIPVRNSQFGKGIQEAVYQMPYRDDGVAEILQMAQQVVSQGDVLTGQNRVQQGQFQKGNKTQTEFETVMTNSNSRQKMSAIALEYSFFTPIKEIIKSNILQYQPPVTIMNSQTKEAVTVDPAKLRQAMISFTLSDGLVPTDKLIDPSTLQMLFQGAQAMPALQSEYDLMGMFTYMMAIRGANWVKDFKRTPQQQQQQLQTMQQAATATGQSAPAAPGAQAPQATQAQLPAQGLQP